MFAQLYSINVLFSKNRKHLFWTKSFIKGSHALAADDYVKKITKNKTKRKDAKMNLTAFNLILIN